jgi:phasin family protein
MAAKTSTSTSTMIKESGLFELGKTFHEFGGIDVDAVITSQQRTIEALTQANQLAVEGAQAVTRRQVEFTRQAIDEFSAMVRELTGPGSIEEHVAKQAEYSKHAVERGVTTARELTELVTKANTDAFNVLSKRVTESFDEMRDFAKKRSATS